MAKGETFGRGFCILPRARITTVLDTRYGASNALSRHIAFSCLLQAHLCGIFAGSNAM